MGSADVRSEQSLLRLSEAGRRGLVGSLLTLAALAPSGAEAHGLWVTERLGKLVLTLGHDDKEDSYPAAKLVAITPAAVDGRPLAALPVRPGSPPFWSVRAPAGLAMLGVAYRGGLSGQRPDGQWVDGPRGTDPAVMRVGRYDKYLLAFLDPAAEPAKAPAARLQLRPDRNPLTLRRGDRLGLRLTWDGKPMPGIAIMADYAGNADLKHAVTDADGRAEVVVQNQGLNVIGAMWIEAVIGDPAIDFVEHLATLSFALRPFSHQPGYMHPAMQASKPDAAALP